jgi:O-antigen ligase
MDRIPYFLVLAYLFFQSWTRAYAPDPRLPVHLIVCIFGVIFFVLHIIINNRKVRTGVYSLGDIFAILLVLSVITSSVFNPRGYASLRYVSAYTYIFIFAYLILKGLFYNLVSIQKLLEWLLYGVLFTSFVAILDTLLDLLYNIDISQTILMNPRAEGLYGGLVPRAAAFSNEPGILAYYLETLGIIGLWVVWHRPWSRSVKVGAIAIIVCGWVAAFSAASVAAVFLATTIAVGIKLLYSKTKLASALLFLAAPVVVAGALLVLAYAQDTFLGSIIQKITLQQDVGSVAMRLSRWREGITMIVNNPVFGVGPGTASRMGGGGTLSWYLFLAAEAGGVSFLIAFLFLLSKLSKIIFSRVRGKYVFLVAFLAGAIHLSVISTFFHPFLWTLIIIFDIMETKCRA